MMIINNRPIGLGYPTYMIAEISANHHHNFEETVKTIKQAKLAGADAIKLQTYTADTITIKKDTAPFRHSSGSLWEGRTLYDLYTEAYMPWEWQPKLKEIVEKLGMDFFSSAFDPTAVDFLEELGVPVHKIASFEIVDIPLIEKMARTGKPLIISTGMATIGEIEEAVTAAKKAGATQIALLKCTSAYPASAEDMNLRTIPHLIDTFGLPVGLSDHTLGVVSSITSVALGACIVEKHFTRSRSVPGPDSAFSIEPHEFKEMVEAIRITEKALGKIHYGPTGDENKSKIFRRSLFVVKDIKAGEKFTNDNIRSIRPGNGLHPKYLGGVLGRIATQDIASGTPLEWTHVG
ncbi:N-acetylneuraminate synthase [Methanolobus vulcani]|jgi:N-acetylneuraminate synthase (EC 2.5.1.56)|uniref:N-acetylneuraminate synthase n=1 Tax=Methanolobus vulcani TaxID=38026 RepID=A0A7Z7FC84_9EURY|nr:pseudaminic acid synthase [Methanolobus vulcani]SDF57794.1 N-acetylneuraminate synthase [Methanolobus vulcani]